MLHTFNYHGHAFTVEYNPIDRSGLGAINEIATNNEYVLDRFASQVNKVFIDIGANIGIATIIMAKLNPASTVYAFEPMIATYNLLLRNIELNRLTNVKPFNLAVSNKTNRTLTLLSSVENTGASTVCGNQKLFNDIFWTSRKKQVQCISMDEIIQSNHIDSIYLLKIDCEGAEFDIIYDSDQFKTGIVHNMVGEFHDFEYNAISDKSDDLLAYCQTHVNGLVKILVSKKLL